MERFPFCDVAEVRLTELTTHMPWKQFHFSGNAAGLSRYKSAIFSKPMNDRRKKSKDTMRQDKTTPGPKPELLKVKGNWKQAIKKSLAKKKPPEGWPK